MKARDLIREKRAIDLIASGMTQVRVAEMLGVSQPTVSNYVRKNSPSNGCRTRINITPSEPKTIDPLQEEQTPQEEFKHHQAALVILSEQAADLADMFRASMRKLPSSVTKEAVTGVYRAAMEWNILATELKTEGR